MKLVIVESPTKAKTLTRYLGDRYKVEASMGHVRDLPKSKLGVDVDHDFEPDYEVSEGKKGVLAKLKKAAKGADDIYLATDPDREGEAIAYHLAYLLAGNTQKAKAMKQFKRVTFHEITKRAIEAALKEPTKLNTDLVDAQQARRVLDRLVGYNLSPVLWKKVRRGLSAGRVQSVAVRLIVEREKEIKAFVPQEYWTILVKLQATNHKPQAEFEAALYEIEGKRIEVRSQELGDREKKGKVIFLDAKAVVEPIVAALKKAAYIVESVEKKERTRRPYPPYTTATLQQAGANVLGWSGKKTMMVAQSLYEAGKITYHRTDSTHLAMEAVQKAREVIATEFGAEMVPEKPVFYATKSKNAQEAHEAIRPTHPAKIDLKNEKNGYSTDQEKLYRLIWRRFMACQMKPAIYDATTITVLATSHKPQTTSYRLRASGSVLKFEGWRVAYARSQKPIADSQQANTNEDVILPEVVEGEKLDYKDLTAEEKATQPPPRYNDASLVKELEKRGIGRPSTYAPTISTIIYRGYVERVEKRFQPTAVGITVTEFLEKYFPQIMDYDFTAEMEEDLDRIARAEKDWRKVMGSFYKPFEKTVETVTESAKRMKVPVEKTGEKCPECKEGELVIRSGRFGKFISCSRFPECKYTARLVQKLEGFVCPLCGGEVILKRTKKGRSFWGCANYPKCDYASWKDPRKEGATGKKGRSKSGGSTRGKKT